MIFDLMKYIILTFVSIFLLSVSLIIVIALKDTIKIIRNKREG